MNRFAAFDSFLAERGIPLGPMIAPDGLFDVAFTVGDALIAVDVAKSCQLPILGGDLWVRADGRLLPAYTRTGTSIGISVRVMISMWTAPLARPSAT